MSCLWLSDARLTTSPSNKGCLPHLPKFDQAWLSFISSKLAILNSTEPSVIIITETHVVFFLPDESRSCFELNQDPNLGAGSTLYKQLRPCSRTPKDLIIAVWKTLVFTAFFQQENETSKEHRNTAKWHKSWHHQMNNVMATCQKSSFTFPCDKGPLLQGVECQACPNLSQMFAEVLKISTGRKNTKPHIINGAFWIGNATTQFPPESMSAIVVAYEKWKYFRKGQVSHHNHLGDQKKCRTQIKYRLV